MLLSLQSASFVLHYLLDSLSLPALSSVFPWFLFLLIVTSMSEFHEEFQDELSSEGLLPSGFIMLVGLSSEPLMLASAASSSSESPAAKSSVSVTLLGYFSPSV